MTTEFHGNKPSNPPLGLGLSEGLGPLPEAMKDYPDHGEKTWREEDMRAYAAQEVAAERKRCATALRTALEGYQSEAITGLPVLPKWRERAMALLDEALRA